jgi:hypothetical protein
MRRLHHEPFEPDATSWELDGRSPLSDANGALPWIVFERDRATFAAEFPLWSVEIRRTAMPFRYLLSGGVSSRLSAPAFSFEFFRSVERMVASCTRACDMFATIVLTRREDC